MLQSAEEAVKMIKMRLAYDIKETETDELNHKFIIGDIGISFYTTELLKIKDRYNDRMGYEDNELKRAIAERENRNG